MFNIDMPFRTVYQSHEAFDVFFFVFVFPTESTVFQDLSNTSSLITVIGKPYYLCYFDKTKVTINMLIAVNVIFSD
jgi:hypothetical protein